MEELRNHVKQALYRPFWFEQACDGSIEHVSFDDADGAAVINLKKQLAGAFASSLHESKDRYTVVERDSIGPVHVQYEQDKHEDGKPF